MIAPRWFRAGRSGHAQVSPTRSSIIDYAEICPQQKEERKACLNIVSLPASSRRRHFTRRWTVLSSDSAFKCRHELRRKERGHSGEMTMPSSSHALLSKADGLATKGADVLILIGRVMLAWVFLASAYGAINNLAGSVGYFTSLKIVAPELFTWVAVLVELLISVSLILGVGTRYGAILAFAFVLVATALAHRYWEYPPGAQQIGQYNNFLKNISIMGGALAILVTGGGRFSLDRTLAK
jgi:putative oxidoreductase